MFLLFKDQQFSQKQRLFVCKYVITLSSLGLVAVQERCLRQQLSLKSELGVSSPHTAVRLCLPQFWNEGKAKSLFFENFRNAFTNSAKDGR